MKERIVMIRKDAGLSQQEFADRLNIKRGTIANYECGRNEPIDAVVTLICNQFNVNEAWLRTGEGEMYVPRTKEDAIAELTLKLLAEKEDSFKNRLIAALAEMSEDQWEMLADLFEKIVKKEQD